MATEPTDKVMTYDQARTWRADLRAAGRDLVMTNGCFDLLHRGHVELLNKARAQGHALLVAVNSDAALRELKGPTRPLVCQDDRAYMLASLAVVDAVVVFRHRKPIDLFQAVVPDIYVKGGDYTVETIDQEERGVLEGLGVRICFIPFVAGRSTTELFERILAAGRAHAL